MPRTVMQIHSTAMVRALDRRVKALRGLSHEQTKGQLRELFVSNLLKPFMTSQFGVGSGIVINQRGEQSDQTDIVIYGNRILPPFIMEANLGVFPVEGVLATIEVKSWLGKRELLCTQRSALKLINDICRPGSNIYRYRITPGSLCAVVGFHGKGLRELSEAESGKAWLSQHVTDGLSAMCVVNKYSWLNMQGQGWVFAGCDRKTNEETKRFIAVILDNIRTNSQKRLVRLTDQHRDWIGVYIRDQNLFGMGET